MIRRAFDEDSAADMAWENHQERLAEDRAEHQAEERARSWTERGEQWAEDVVYGEA